MDEGLKENNYWKDNNALLKFDLQLIINTNLMKSSILCAKNK
jgi:hypothetical protein